MSSDHFGSRFTVIEQIGGGNYGTLFRVIDGEADSLAERIIATKKLKDAINHPHVLREVSVQRHAQQYTRHVAKLLHVVPRDRVRAALVLEYVPLDLRIFLNTFYCERVVSSAPTWCATENCDGVVNGAERTHIPLAYVRSMLRGLLEALQCLHARGIAHRDVKPENILVEPLGLDHPLRCVCPPLSSTPTTTSATDPTAISNSGVSTSNGSSGANCCCWVHARPPQNNTVTGGTHAAPCRAPATIDSPLEPCRRFFHNSVLLHHELTGEDLAHTLHLLHCAMCRRAVISNTSEETTAAVKTRDATLQKSAQFENSEKTSGSNTETESCVEQHGVSIALNVEEESDNSNDDATPSSTKRANGSIVQAKAAAVAAAKEKGTEEGQHNDNANRMSTPPLSPDVKLCDFGSARYIGTLRLRSAAEQREELTPGPTTPVYCAPEVMLLQQYGTAADMWAVGVILFEMLTGEFFLSVGTLRSFYGDLVVHDDYCVMHRLNMMFRHLGTPSAEEWQRIAHPLYYPDAMLPHLPQIPYAPLFKCLSRKCRVNGVDGNGHTDGTESKRNEEGTVAELSDKSSSSEDNGSSPREPLTPGEESNEEKGKEVAKGAGFLSTSTTTTTPHSSSSAGEAAVPDLSAFLLRHIGVCGMDFLRSLLRYHPEDRLTATEALRHPFLAEHDGVKSANIGEVI